MHLFRGHPTGLRLPAFYVLALCLVTPTQAQVLDDTPPISGWQPVNRLGLNLGNQSHWGAGQLLSNVLPNPGFEAWTERSLVTVTQATRGTLALDKPWNARDDHQWTGAQATVLTGPSAGQHFTINDNTSAPPNSATLYASDLFASNLSLTGEVLSVAQQQLSLGSELPLTPSKWRATGQVRLVSGSALPGLGKTVTRFNPLNKTASLQVWLDALSERAGPPLLPIRSDWVLALNVRSSGLAKLEVEVSRDGGAGRFTRLLRIETEQPDNQWSIRQWPLRADSPETVGTLSVKLTARGMGLIDVDNVYLGPASGLDSFMQGQQSVQAFRPEVLAMLKLLAPGYLRDWQGQLGDSPRNRFAPAAARQPHKYRKLETELFSGYSLPEFLALCHSTQAKPWIVLPSTWSVDEIKLFARLLHESLSQYPATPWVLEFGNENWNSTFEAGGFVNIAQHAEVANRSWEVFKQAYQTQQPRRPLPHWLNNHQFVNPPSKPALEAFKEEAQWSVASYSVHSLNTNDNVSSLFDTKHRLRWQRWQKLARALGRTLWVPEVNLHPLSGSLNGRDKTHLLRRPEAGVALADNLLTGWLHGATTQVLYQLVSFDTFDAKKDLVPLFGLTSNLRNLLPSTEMLRPSGQAMWLLNQWLRQDSAHIKLLSAPNIPLLTVALTQQPDKTPAVIDGVAYLNRSDQFKPWPPTLAPTQLMDRKATQKKDSARVHVWQLSGSGLQHQSEATLAKVSAWGGLPPHSLLLIRRD